MTTTHGIVVQVLTDLTLALIATDTGCFDEQEVIGVRDALQIVAARSLPEDEYNAKARLLLAGLLDVASVRDPAAVATCKLAAKMKKAYVALIAAKK